MGKQLRLKRAQRKLRLKEGFWKRLLRALPVLILAMLLTVSLSRGDDLHEFAADSQDFLMHLRSGSKEKRVVLVVIGDEEYEKDFKKDGSLNSDKLMQLIGAIAKGNPAVIGVDIDTSDQRYRDSQTPQAGPPVVWVRGVYEPVTDVPTPRDVLGGKDPRLNDEPHSGLPVLYDVNKVTRLYQRIIQTTEGYQASFPWAVVKNFNPKIAEQRTATTDRLLIGYANTPSEELSASQILEVSNEPQWPINDKVRDKIVLVGATYLGQDRHQTPLGEKEGVYSMAAAIETELNGGGIKQPDEYAFFPLWVLQGVVLVILFQYFPLREALGRNLAWSLALVFGCALICSLIASLVAARALTYLSLVYLTYFLPVALFVFVDQLRELINDWRKGQLGEVYVQLKGGPTTKGSRNK